MTKSLISRLFTAAAMLASVLTPGLASAHTDFLGLGISGCAFEDVDDDGIFTSGTDIPVPDSAWIGGTAFLTNHPFVVPVGCNHTLVTPPLPLQGVVVTATKITFLGKLDYLSPGGRGITMVADPGSVPAPGLGNGDMIIGNGSADVLINAGGVSTHLPLTTPGVPRKSVSLLATGDCQVLKASILGNRPIQNTMVGMLCTGDMVFRSATVIGSRVNIQSLAGFIDARSFAPPPGASLADRCDDPALNLVGGGGAPGNGNGVVDAGDFPCQLDLAAIGLSPVFGDLNALAAFCAPTDPAGQNVFRAFNDPLVMIAGAGAGNNLDVRGAATGRTSIVGRYRVTLAAEDGDVLTQNADIDHGEQLGLVAPGGARIWVFANPTSITRLPADREDFFGPSTGITNVNNACYRSPNNVNVGQDGGGLVNLAGTPQAPPCKQLNQFVPVLNGIF